MRSSLIVILLLSSFILSSSSPDRSLLFDSFFQWAKAEFSVVKAGFQGTSTFLAEINSNEKGVYLKINSLVETDNANFIEEISYTEKTSVNNQLIIANVFDYDLMDCEFKQVSTWLEKRFQFRIRTFGAKGKSQGNYTFLARFKTGAGLLGGVDLNAITETLQKQCEARKQAIRRQIEEEAREKERKRVETELMKQADEAREKALQERIKAEQEQAQKQKEEDERKKEEERKKKEADDAERKRKEEEKARQEREEEERKKLEEERIKAAKDADEKSRLEEEKRVQDEARAKQKLEEERARQEEERKQKEQEKKEQERIEAERKQKEEDSKKEVEERARKEEEEKKKSEEEAKKKLEEEVMKQKVKEEEVVSKAVEEKETNEKKFFENYNALEVNFDCGFGKAIFITGQDQKLGNWQVAYRLTPVQKNLWVYKNGNLLKDGTIFKTLIARWDEGESFKMTDAALYGRPVFWENPSGEKGNKIMKFDEYLMKHKPNYQNFK